MNYTTQHNIVKMIFQLITFVIRKGLFHLKENFAHDKEGKQANLLLFVE